MIEILIGAIALFAVLALVIISRDKYIQWLERRLAQVRVELSQLQQMRTQPWLQGATTEWHLQKRIKELKKLQQQAWQRATDAEKRVVEMEMDAGSSTAMIMLKKRDERIKAWESLYGAFPGGPACNYQATKNDSFHKGYAKASKFVDQLEGSIANLVIDKSQLKAENEALKKEILNWEMLYGKYPAGPALLAGKETP